jgi:succinate dehydrogenase / fumarate reductase flavoprotein subunit
MLDLVLVDGHARGIICRNLVDGKIERYAADAVVVATGGYSTVYYLSTNAVQSNATAIWRCHKRGALYANPSFMQIHPTCIPQMGEGQSKLTLMSESLRNDGRIWVPKKHGDKRAPKDIPDAERDYFLERRYPAFGNLVPRDVASRAAKQMCDQGFGVGATGRAVYLDFAEAIGRLGESVVRDRYGNLFDMYHEITDENPYKVPMQIYPAPHYTMGGLWVDYNLMSTIPGLHVIGEANFSDHGANRLGASALMQGLADGYFVLPYTIGNYLAGVAPGKVKDDHPAFAEAEANVNGSVRKLLSLKGKTTARELHWKLGRLMFDHVGMARNAKGLTETIEKIRALRAEFWENVQVEGSADDLNKALEYAGRVADYFELAELIALDALSRDESCGCHLREEHQTEEGEAVRDDANYSYVAAWEYTGDFGKPRLHREKLEFENVHLATRNYK